jgi:hypothetical protein
MIPLGSYPAPILINCPFASAGHGDAADRSLQDNMTDNNDRKARPILIIVCFFIFLPSCLIEKIGMEGTTFLNKQQKKSTYGTSYLE